MRDSFADKDYNDRLKELDLTTLETRRKRGDLIEAFKIIKWFEDVNNELFFPLTINTVHLRGSDLKIKKRKLILIYERTSSVKRLSMTGIYCQKL